jgi:hypothetical protein
VNQAAPPPTPGPLSASTKTFEWSIMERSISSAKPNLSPDPLKMREEMRHTWRKPRQISNLFLCFRSISFRAIESRSCIHVISSPSTT